MTDRGTPLISDPGNVIVDYAIKNNINVIALPGASALLPALNMSGISNERFLFYGFLNSKKSEAKKELIELKEIKQTIIFYEAPHRINDTLLDISQIMGNNRKISISREITKKYEEIYRGTVQDLINENNEYKGELVIVLEGNNSIKEYEMSIFDHINLYIEDGYNSNGE